MFTDAVHGPDAPRGRPRAARPRGLSSTTRTCPVSSFSIATAVKSAFTKSLILLAGSGVEPFPVGCERSLPRKPGSLDGPRRQSRVGSAASREQDVRSIAGGSIPGDSDRITCHQPGMEPLVPDPRRPRRGLPRDDVEHRRHLLRPDDPAGLEAEVGVSLTYPAEESFDESVPEVSGLYFPRLRSCHVARLSGLWRLFPLFASRPGQQKPCSARLAGPCHLSLRWPDTAGARHGIDRGVR